MKKYTAKEVMSFPNYTDYTPCLSKNKNDRMRYYWKYFHKYYDDYETVITAEDADNEWGIVFVITTYFRSAKAAKSHHSITEYEIWEDDEPRKSIPVRCDKIVGSKSKEYLERNHQGKKRKTIKRKPR